MQRFSHSAWDDMRPKVDTRMPTVTKVGVVPTDVGIHLTDLLDLTNLIKVSVPFESFTCGELYDAAILGMLGDSSRLLIAVETSKKRPGHEERTNIGWWSPHCIEEPKFFTSVHDSVRELCWRFREVEDLFLVANDQPVEREKALRLILRDLSSGASYSDIFKSDLKQFKDTLSLPGKFYVKHSVLKCWALEGEDGVMDFLTLDDVIEFVGLHWKSGQRDEALKET